MYAVRKQTLLPLLAGVMVVVADRAAWASVSQWREDPATNMWLAYTRGALHVPVGLVSSVGVPNPNGLVLASVVLSRIPNLWIVSTLLGMVQAALVIWACWLAAAERRLFLIMVVPLLSSIMLRSTSVELWSQAVMYLPNMVFIAAMILYIRRPTAWILPLLAWVMLLSPSIYLAGVVNSVAYALVAAVVLFIKRARVGWRGWIAPIIVSGALVIVSVALTWWPYFNAVGIGGLRDASRYSDLTKRERVVAAAGAIIRFPSWALVESSSSLEDMPLQIDQRMLPPTVFWAYQFSQKVVLVQGLICYLAVLAAGIRLVARGRPFSNLVAPARRITGATVILMLAVVLLAHVIAPLLGGPVWAQGERLDEVAQFVPYLLVIWFVTPLLLEMAPWIKRAVLVLTCATGLLFASASWVAGVAVVVDNLRYRGPMLGEADVPLVNKLSAMGFVAQDWKSRSSSVEIPVGYDLGGGRWDWVSRYGKVYEKWYPAPYTIGRELDYVLLREYGLSNSQEGVQLRSFGTGRYLITYAFRPAPVVQGRRTREIVFGRLRVTVAEDEQAEEYGPQGALFRPRSRINRACCVDARGVSSPPGDEAWPIP